MDRLICGDVGFGKTEIAMRAAFKAVLDGKQVAVLVSDHDARVAALAHVHGAVRAVPVRVESLSRWVPRRRSGKILAERGVEGRHRDRHAPSAAEGRDLRGPRPARRRRGAAVRRQAQGRAEEAEAERRRADDDRNAHSANAPHGADGDARSARSSTRRRRIAARSDVRRAVRRADDGLERIRRELPREGQVFFVHNRVQGIEAIALPPEARARSAHRGRARADGREEAREGHARVHRDEARRAGLDDDHRGGNRHPQREHDDRRPRRLPRPGAALPAPRTRRPRQASAGTRLPRPDREAGSTGVATRGSRRCSRTPSSAPGSRSRRWTSRSAAAATCSAGSSTGRSRQSASTLRASSSKRR